MAGVLIDIDVDKVDRTAAELTDDSESIRDIIKVIDTVIENIEYFWKSQYTREYLDSLIETRDRISRLAGQIDETSESLRNTTGKVRRAEQEAKSIVDNNYPRGGGFRDSDSRIFGGITGGGSGGGNVNSW